MQDYLEYHKLNITALAPVHVGDGKTIGKKEYIRLMREKKVIIPDIGKMFRDLTALKKDRAFSEYMLDDYKNALGEWINEQRIPEKYIREWTSYTLNAADAFRTVKQNGKTSTPKEIRTFVKDAYGMPYVPGSAVKGMIRTALAAYEISNNRAYYKRELEQLERTALSYESGSQGKTFLKKETEIIEAKAFNTLARTDSFRDAVNSVMSGIIVSDSASISVDCLTLSQKIDYSTEGKIRELPILRETLIPGTDIEFDLTIDRKISRYTLNDILDALDLMNKAAYKYFYRRFNRGCNEKGIVWIGGGAGFLSKTFLYALYGEDAVKITDSIYKKTIGKNYDTHRHKIDIEKGLSPHVCKCTLYHGNLYDMGMGRIEVIS